MRSVQDSYKKQQTSLSSNSSKHLILPFFECVMNLGSSRWMSCKCQTEEDIIKFCLLTHSLQSEPLPTFFVSWCPLGVSSSFIDTHTLSVNHRLRHINSNTNVLCLLQNMLLKGAATWVLSGNKQNPLRNALLTSVIHTVFRLVTLHDQPDSGQYRFLYYNP